MYRIDSQYAATAQPVPTPQGTGGYYTEGNPQTGVSPTIVSADWLNGVQEELMTILQKGGITPNKTNNGQLLQALSALFTGAFISVTTTQNLLVPPWATQIGFRLVGAGGGGAHAQTTGTNYRSGGGGGSGAYCEAQRAVTAGALLTATIGIGGGSEANGTDTSLAFPGHWTVTAGGGYSAVWSAPTNSPGGSGGTPSGGDLNSYGSFGGDGMASGVWATTGYGGPGFWGGGGRAGNGGGALGRGPGAGGAGAYDTTNSGNLYPGAAGANGIIQYRFIP